MLLIGTAMWTEPGEGTRWYTRQGSGERDPIVRLGQKGDTARMARIVQRITQQRLKQKAQGGLFRTMPEAKTQEESCQHLRAARRRPGESPKRNGGSEILLRAVRLLRTLRVIRPWPEDA